MTELHQLYGDPNSYYSAKVIAYLRYKGIPFTIEQPNPQAYEKVIVPRTGVAFIPVVITPDDLALQDTTAIIDFLETRFLEPSVYPAGPVQKLVTLIFELFGDEFLLIPAMHYRWAHNREHILDFFGRLTAPDADPTTQRAVGEKFSAPFRGSLPLLGIIPESVPAIEYWYEKLLLPSLDAHFAAHAYLLGGRPSIGDYGLFAGLYAHLYRDPYSGALLRRIAPHVARWLDQMWDGDQGDGDFVAEDAIPETLVPVLAIIFRDQFPLLVETVAALESWFEGHQTPIPRTIGGHHLRLPGPDGKTVSSPRQIFPYAQWMLQRVTDQYQSLDPDDRAKADRLCAAAGAPQALDIDIRTRVTRRNNLLVAE